MKSTTCSRSLKTTALMAAISLAAICPKASAAPYYWGQTTVVSGTYSGNAATAANWFTDAAGINVSGTAPNSLSDDLIFNTTPANAVGGVISVGANLSANSLTFTTSGSTVLAQDATNRLLNLGAGGITVNSGAGAVSIGTNAHDPALTVQVTDDQTWTNSSASALTVRRLRSATGAGATSLTFNAASSGAITVSTGITDSIDDPLSIVIDSSSTGLVTFSGVGTQNNYRGGTTINGGALSAFGSLGSGAVLLGDTTGSTSATLNVRSNTAFTNNITVRDGSSGIKTLTTNQTGGVVVNGTLTLNDNLSLVTSTAGTFNGDISGVGNLVKTGTGTLVLAGDNTASGDLTINLGALTLADSGSLTFTIGANGVNNQLNGSSAGVVTLDGTFNFNLTGASLVDGNSWTIVSLGSTAEIYGGTFAITGFTETANVWTNGSGFTFTESTGVLSYAIPEPSTFVFLIGGVLCFFVFGNRRQTRAAASR